jgi:putative hydrolase of the HAD superfamily
MAIKALIWDLEGVLLISRDGKVETTIAKNLGVTEEAIGDFFHNDFNDRLDLGEFNMTFFWLRLLDQLGLPHERIDEINDFFYRDLFIDQDMLAKIRAFRSRYKTALLSNYSEVLRPMLETRWRVDGAFDEIIISNEVGLIKPDPRIFDLTLSRLGVDKEEALLIDDREVNIRGARQYGLPCIFFQSKDEALEELDQILKKN